MPDPRNTTEFPEKRTVDKIKISATRHIDIEYKTVLREMIFTGVTRVVPTLVLALPGQDSAQPPHSTPSPASPSASKPAATVPTSSSTTSTASDASAGSEKPSVDMAEQTFTTSTTEQCDKEQADKSDPIGVHGGKDWEGSKGSEASTTPPHPDNEVSTDTHKGSKDTTGLCTVVKGNDNETTDTVEGAGEASN